MFQLGFGLVSDSGNPSWWMNILRTVFASVDIAVYSLISFIYQILFQITDADIVSPDIVTDIYGRIQLILGVVMIFKLAISILQVIINPDLLNDQKMGTGKIISKILIMLVLFVSTIPLNIPGNIKEKSYNEYISNNGLLFGTLFSLQHRIMSNNTLERFVFGTNQKNDGKIKINDKETGSRMAAYILRGFVRPNLKAESKSDELNDPNNYVCNPDDAVTSGGENNRFLRLFKVSATLIAGGGIAGGAIGTAGSWLIDKIASIGNKETMATFYTIYASGAATTENILDIINVQCQSGYAFTYLPIISSICGIIILIALIGSCIDIAIRTIKLTILRLIAPIPIISYIDPKSSENGTFANWVKMLTTTYLDLFIRVLIIYFVIYIVAAITGGDIDLGFATSIYGILATIFVIIGLFIFIRQAPKFIKDALGLKGTMSNIGLSGILGGASGLIGGRSLAGAALGAMQSTQMANQAASEGKAFSPFNAWSQTSDQMAKIRTNDKDARGGVLGGLMDYALYRTRESNLGRKNLSAQNKEKAKNAHYKEQEILHNAEVNRELALEKVKQAGITSKPRLSSEEAKNALQGYENYAKEQGWDDAYKDNSVYKSMVKQVEDAKLWEDYEKADNIYTEEQTRAAKVERNFKNISDARSAAGVDPRLIDEYETNSFRAYREGGKKQKFNPYSESDTSTLDDVGPYQGAPAGSPQPGNPYDRPR